MGKFRQIFTELSARYMIMAGYYSLKFLFMFKDLQQFQQIFDLAIDKGHPGKYFFYFCDQGWSGMAKVSCILTHRGVQLILAYSWARPAIRVAGKGRGECVFFFFFGFFPFILVPLSFLSLSFISFSISFLPFSGRQQNDPHGLMCR